MKRFVHVLKYALVLPVMIGLVACDAAGPDATAQTLNDTELTEMVTALSTDLELTDAQASAIQNSFAQHQGDEARQPGYLWYVAADLQETLSDEEKARLFAKAEAQRERFQARRDGQDRPQRRRGRHGRGQGPEGMHLLRGRIAEELGLTDDQQASIKTIMESHKDDFKALHTAFRSGELTRDELRTQMTTLREEIEAEVATVLTEEQQTQLDALKQQRADRREERKENVQDRRDESHAAMVEVLDLTQTQQDALATLKEEQKAKAAEIREQVQNGSLDREGVKEALQALHAEGQASRAAILNGTQQEIVNIHRALAQRVMVHKAKQHRQRRGRPQQG